MTIVFPGVIERRKIHRTETDYGTATPPQTDATSAVFTPSTMPKAFGKIKVRGVRVPDQRSGFVNRMSSGANTPGGVYRSPSKDALSGIVGIGGGGGEAVAHSEVLGAHGSGTRTREGSLSRTILSQDQEAREDDERKPLLKKNTGNRWN